MKKNVKSLALDLKPVRLRDKIRRLSQTELADVLGGADQCQDTGDTGAMGCRVF